MLFPYRIDTLFKHLPCANWVIMGLTVLVFLLTGVLPEEVVEAMVLDGWSITGLFGHGLLHAGFFHLAGNMIFLWVFGNAVCANTSNRWFPLYYVGFALAAALTHIVCDGELAVGASGAINGVVGMAVAMYPLNRVSVWWFAFLRFGTFQVPLWGLALFWLFFDLLGAARGGGDVAYWAHVGGFFAGLATGWLALRKGWVELTEYDHRSLEEILAGKTEEARRDRIRKADEEENRAAASSHPLVLTMTAPALARWRAAAEAQEVSEQDSALIQAGGDRGEWKNFELLYGRSFLGLGFSFHHSLAAYYRCVGEERCWPHEMAALAGFLRMVEADYEAMRRIGFVDDELHATREEEKLSVFLAGPRR
jgi:membrane associated rhomboid family serine protease